MKHILPLLLSLFIANSYAQSTWTQIGPDIDGDPNDGSGFKLGLNYGATIMAVSASNAPVGGTSRGRVLVYERSGNAWIAKGNPINGTQDGELFGNALEIDSAGTSIIIGRPYNDGSFGAFSNAGLTQVYTWNGSDWVQKGSDLPATTAGDNYGSAVAISNDGLTIAIGAFGSADSGTEGGHAQVFRWNGSDWAPLAGSILAEGQFDNFGVSVSLSSDGNILAVGGNGNDGAGTGAGHVRVFQWNGAAWVQMGTDLDADADSDMFGNEVSISSDGTALAVGAPQDFLGGFGYVKIFDWNGSAWNQRGSNIASVVNGDEFGYSVSLSWDGQYVAVGARNGVAPYLAGRAEVYYWNSTAWVLHGDTLKGETDFDGYGDAVEISHDGSLVAVGASVNVGNGSNGGHVRTFEQVNCNPYQANLGPDIVNCDIDSLNAGVTGASYTWSTGDTTEVINVDTSGQYSVIVNYTPLACTTYDTINVTINQSPVVGLVHDTAQCGDSVMFDVSAVTGTYLWSTGSTGAVIYSDTSEFVWVDVTNNGCTTRDSSEVTIHLPPILDLGNDTIVCEYYYLDARSVDSATSFVWNDGNVSPYRDITDSGTYSVIATRNECISYDTIQIYVNPFPEVNLPFQLKLCDTTAVLDGGPGDSFLWNTGATTQTITADSSKKYFLQLTKDGCTTLDSTTVTIDSAMAVILGSDTIVCGSKILRSGYDNATYSWNTGDTTRNITADTTGLYVVNVSQGGCFDTDSVMVTIKNYPSVDLGNDTILCGTLFLDAQNAGNTYLWNSGENTQTIDAETGQYARVEVTEDGCATEDSIRLGIWQQKGADITGGKATVTTMAGLNTMAVGIPDANTNGTKSGEVKVFSWNGTAWVQKGATLTGAEYERFGFYIVMPDENTLAVRTKTAYNVATNSRGPNYVKVYNWNGSAWTQKGTINATYDSTITVNTTYDSYTNIRIATLSDGEGSIAMSDPNTIAISVKRFTRDSYDQSKQHSSVRVFTWNGTDWIQKGAEGQLDAAQYFSFSLTRYYTKQIEMPDQNTIAVHIIRYSMNTTYGITKVYYWNGNSWTAKGGDIGQQYYGESYYYDDGATNRISMPSANMIAIGIPTYKNLSDNDHLDLRGNVRIFTWNSSAWVQQGSNLSKYKQNTFGYSVSMPDTNTIAVGALHTDIENVYYQYDDWTEFGYTKRPTRGEINIYQWNGSDWEQQGLPIQGMGEFDQIGRSVYMPAPNTVGFVSFNGDNILGRVYYTECLDSVPAVGFDDYGKEKANTEQNIVLYPNPSAGSVRIKALSDMHFNAVQIYTHIGVPVKTITYDEMLKEATIDLTDIKNGLYIVKVLGGKHQAFKRLLLEK